MPRVRCVCLLIDILAPLDPLRKNMAAVRPENGEFLQRVEECEKGGKYSYYARAKGETGEENGNERSTEIRMKRGAATTSGATKKDDSEGKRTTPKGKFEGVGKEQ
ncbi:hypothetical protein V1477_008688, partial [Vespula maculifrons]